MKTKLLTTILGLFFVISTFAQQSGTCGDDLTWTLSAEGVLTISGTGRMMDYATGNLAPWSAYVSSFKSLVIEEGISHIGERAFSSCSGFTGNLTIPNSVETIGRMAFYSCSGFTGNLTLPGSVETIKEIAFANCTGFDGSLLIPNSLKTVESGAFESCSGLISISIPSSLKSIGECAFGYCSSLTSIDVDPDNPNYSSENGILYNKNKTILLQCPNGKTGDLPPLPGTITTIEVGAFTECRGLTGSLILPHSVKTIGPMAFAHCSGLTGSLILPNSLKTIGSMAFFHCYGFTGNLALPNSLEVIESLAFTNCYGFTGELTLPGSVIIIERDAFAQCSGFTGNLTIPHSVIVIGHYAFADCGGFTGDLIIPNSVKMIESGAFAKCSGFDGNLTIGSSVEMIGNMAFSNCKGFTSITSEAITPPMLLYSFYDIPNSIPLTVPAGTKSAYEATSWSYFTNIIEASGSDIRLPEGVKVYTQGKEIIISGIEKPFVSVFDITGRRIAEGAMNRIVVPQTGVYIVKVCETSRKLIIKN